MPNSKPPIQRASRICEMKASSALTTRMRKAAPARRRASEDSLPSATSARSREIVSLRSARQEWRDGRRQEGRGACSEPIDATTTSAPPQAQPEHDPWGVSSDLAERPRSTGNSDGARDSNEALRFGWKKLIIMTGAMRLMRAPKVEVAGPAFASQSYAGVN